MATYEEVTPKRYDKLKNFGIFLLLAWAVIFAITPILYMFLTSLKSRADIYAIPPKIFFTPTIEAYRNIIVNEPFVMWMSNTIIITAAATLIAITLGTIAGYALSRFTFRGKDDLAFYILSIRMLPPIAAAVPIYLIMRNLGLIDTQAGLILAYTTFNLPFAVWMMKIFIDNIPAELEEAAMTDGCTRMQAFRAVTFPLIKPSILAVAIFCIIFSWNEFLFALILTNRSAVTMPVGITTFVTWKEVNWEYISAGSVMLIAPVLAFTLLVQKHLVAGLTMGAVRE